MSQLPQKTLGKLSYINKQPSVAKTATDTINPGITAWVVFSGRADLAWLRILKRGYRHCFVLIQQRQQWLVMDPLASHSEIILADMPGDFDLPCWYARQGLGVMAVNLPTPVAKPQPWRLFTCVEAVKRVLGIRGRWVFTPWQLACHLRRHYAARRVMPHIPSFS
jgi:hypothetical protein